MSKNIEMNYKISDGYEVIYPQVQIQNVINLQSNISNLQSQINKRLSLSGGTMTGNLILNGNPSSTNQAANKGYVDSQLSKPIEWEELGNFTGKTGTTQESISNSVILYKPTGDYYNYIYWFDMGYSIRVPNISNHYADVTVSINDVYLERNEQMTSKGETANYRYVGYIYFLRFRNEIYSFLTYSENFNYNVGGSDRSDFTWYYKFAAHFYETSITVTYNYCKLYRAKITELT